MAQLHTFSINKSSVFDLEYASTIKNVIEDGDGTRKAYNVNDINLRHQKEKIIPMLFERVIKTVKFAKI